MTWDLAQGLKYIEKCLESSSEEAMQKEVKQEVDAAEEGVGTMQFPDHCSFLK